jgi:hypothetical protein
VSGIPPSLVERWNGRLSSSASRWRIHGICAHEPASARSRAREVYLDYMIGPNAYASTDASLRRYFDIFAIGAARARASK